MDFQKLTLKSQEAVAAAQELARRSGHPELTPDHLIVALLDQELPRTLVDRAGYGAGELRAEAEARLALLPTVTGGGQPHASARLGRVLDAAGDSMRELERRVRLGRASSARARRRSPRRAARSVAGRAGRPEGDVTGSGRLLPGAREVRPRPDHARRVGQARSRHRARRGDPSRHAGALAAHEEQSCSHR